ncbi:MAG: hypothetical protein C0406_07745 [Sideroxydans sp.]|nr:hypothetical protein [Sideroxydans sp.]
MKKSLIFISAVLFAFTQVAEAAVAGRFQFVNGDVKVVAANGKERSASKGSEVNEGESVVTSSSSSAQIKMEDDGLIVVRPDTKLRITTFLYSGKTDGSERSFISLFKGSFRAITGAIGRVNKDNYMIETPTATIGIRGTDHEPTFIPNPLAGQVAIAEPGTYDKVNSGAAVLSTANGMIVIKPDQAGFVPNVGNAAPKILATIPAFMRTVPTKDEPKIVPQAGATLKEGTATNPNQPIGAKGGATSLQPVGAKGALTPLANGGTGATLGTAKTIGGVGVISPTTTLKSGALVTGVGATTPVTTTPPATLSPIISTSKSLTTGINTPVITTTTPKVLSPTLTNIIAPTVTPTVSPTVSPTIAPVIAPTTIKTLSPTITNIVAPAPVVAPTVTPTISPTVAPTVAPVVAPTTIKVLSPTVTNIIAPTVVAPTVTPTIAPTIAPVISPTVVAPAPAPTVSPTITPVIAPTTTIQPIKTTIQPITTFSDRRLKTNVKRIGTHRLGIYEFDYVWGEHATGVMADEVKTVMPEAVTRHSSGYDMVDYSKLQ